MSLSMKPYKGSRDFYPELMRPWRGMFEKMRRVLELYAYEEYQGPLLESFDLYAAKTGEEIVNKQLYSFLDRGERKIAIRPEMTPTLARMVASKFQELPKPIRWFSTPNLWRYERPQRGRLREHWQLNVDILGGNDVLADAEILNVAWELICAQGGEEHIDILVNHRNILDNFFKSHLKFSPDVAYKVVKAIDARSKIGEDAYQNILSELGVNQSQIKKIDAFLSSSIEDVQKNYPSPGGHYLFNLLSHIKKLSSELSGSIKFEPKIMRGLDYYTGFIFEIFDKSPENNRSMFGGGRYDNLIGLFGKNQLSGVGFGMGDVILQNFLETHGLWNDKVPGADVYITTPTSEALAFAQSIAKLLRKSGIKVLLPLEFDQFKKQLKQATQHKVGYAIILGDEELKSKKLGVKNLSTGTQETVDLGNLVDFFSKTR